MNMLTRTAFALLALSLTVAPANSHAQSNPLSTLRSGHPRLIFLDSDIPRIKSNIAADPFAAANFAELKAEGDKMLTQPVKPYVIKGAESNLLDTARDVEHIVLSLSGLYRLTGDRRYADRAIEEMLSSAAFPDWYPKHFLDTGELTAALGLGYDWLYPILTAEQRTIIRTAIVTHGLNPWIEVTRPASAANPKGPIFKYTNNWVQVCVGGETIGALAVAEDEPALARTIVTASEQQMRTIMKLFAPDGGFEEGPTYWGYATSYNSLYLAALDSALGNDFGLSQMPGFPETGVYRLQAISPDFKTANFGDAHDDVFRAPQMFWMATKFNKPEYALGERRINEAFPHILPRNTGEAQRFLIFALVWYHAPATPSDPSSPAANPPTVQSYQRTDQAFLRSAWTTPDGQTDTNAFYVAFKGGYAKASHGHLDIGSFVLDALGERWAIDLGPESYGVPHYFDFNHDRWIYFRTRTESHNTLLVANSNEDLDTYARLTTVGHTTSGSRKFAVMDLQSAYKSQLKNWQRGIEILQDTSAPDHGNNSVSATSGQHSPVGPPPAHLPSVLLQDELTPNGPTDVIWNMFTHAAIKTGAHQDAELMLHGKTLHLRILSPAGAQFEFHAVASPPAPQTAIKDVNALSIHFPQLARPETITILFTADPTNPASTPAIVPLAQWSKPASAPPLAF